ncbi:MAG: VapC toxin family domain ribonuclease [Rhodospirillales bacterium]|nr:VapC toxin family domain ribonuclease [Rhodospirillales bacterium]
MSFLLDTNTISDLFRERAPVIAWARGVDPHRMWLSVLTIGELRRWVLTRPDPVRKEILDRWLSGVSIAYADRILPIDAVVAETWASMTAQRPRAVVNALLAATARVHGLAVVTRNVADFAEFGIDLINPYEASA